MKKVTILLLLAIGMNSWAADTDTIRCADIRSNTVTEGLHWVKGFIMGWPKSAYTYTTEEPIEGANSQLTLADDAQGTNCIPVQVSYAARMDLGNVADHIGQKIVIRGNVGKYFGVNGLTGTSAVEFLDPIHITNFSITPTSKTISVTESFRLIPTITPADADDQRIEWTSSHPDIVAVSNGIVTGIKNGTATITAKTMDGGLTATCQVTVETTGGEVRMADIIVVDSTSATTTSYVEWNCVGQSGTHYNGKSAKDSQAMQFTGDSKHESGIVSTSSVGYIREIQIAWNSNNQDRVIYVFGSNSALSRSDLQDETVVADHKIGEIAKGTKSFAVTGNYAYVGLRVKSKAAYLDTVTFVWGITRHDDEDIALTAIELDQHTLDLEQEETAKINVIYTPIQATNKGVTWTSSNPAVASVEKGLVTAITPGQTYIIATATENSQIKDSCLVNVRKKDIFRGRDVYYKIKDINELHNGDSIILVNEDYNRASAAFETYTSYDKTTQTDVTMGRIKSADLEIVRDGDSIGCWGVENLHLVNTAQGWQILTTVLEPDPYEEGALVAFEALLRASKTNKLMIKGEGNKFWDIAIAANGDVTIASKDQTAGKIQFNTNNKSFTTYTSEQGTVQIYRKKVQVIDPNPMVNPIEDDDTAIEDITTLPNYKKMIINGTLYIRHNDGVFDVLGRCLEHSK